MMSGGYLVQVLRILSNGCTIFALAIYLGCQKLDIQSHLSVLVKTSDSQDIVFTGVEGYHVDNDPVVGVVIISVVF